MKEMTAKDSLVSVIVPTYNRAHLIVFTLDSVFRQTYRPIEVLIVDDGSHDKTEEVVRDWAAQQCVGDERFSLQYVRQNNAGPSAARNTGLRECSGEFIQFLDSDDIVHPEKLAKQVTAIRRNSVDFCVCNCRTFGSSQSAAGSVRDFYSRSHHLDDFPSQYPMHTAAVLLSRRVVERNGPWPEYLSAGEDFEYNFRMVARGAKGIWLNEELLQVRTHDSPERIQARPLATRCRSMYLGLATMEIEAVARGICSKRFLNSLGIRAYQYYRHTRAEGSLAEAGVFFRYARPRLFWRTKANLWLRQVLPTPIARVCAAAKGLVGGRKR